MQKLFQRRGLQTFLSEGHRSYFTTVRGPGMLHDVIVFGYMLHSNNPTNFSKIYYFFIIEKMVSMEELCGQDLARGL